jgi:hypothetical protein
MARIRYYQKNLACEIILCPGAKHVNYSHIGHDLLKWSATS